MIEEIEMPCEKCNGTGLVKIICPGSLRKHRESMGISLRELAKILGLSAPYLCDVERGRRNCTKKLLTAYNSIGQKRK